jgi:hypothetical protein
MTLIKQTKFANDFKCLTADCPDTCCINWKMQVNQDTLTLYRNQAPELLNVVDQTADQPAMKLHPATKQCMKFEQGLCGIHQKYGKEYLGDACYFYPYVIRKIGDQVISSASLSCPEITRLVLLSHQPFTLIDRQIDRIPQEIKDYSEHDLDHATMLSINQKLLELFDTHQDSCLVLARIIAIANGLDNLPQNQWLDQIDSLEMIAIPTSEMDHLAPYKLLNLLVILLKSAKQDQHPRLLKILSDMARMLGAGIDWQELAVTAQQAVTIKYDHQFDQVLTRYLQAQLVINVFPFAGPGATIKRKIIIITIKFALIRLALLPILPNINEAEVVRVIQVLSRFLDHLADYELFFLVCEDLGWTQTENLLRLIIGR